MLVCTPNHGYTLRNALVKPKDLQSGVIANEQAERRREACEAASLMPREVVQQAEKFSIVLRKV